MGITSIFWNRKGAPKGDVSVPTGMSTGYIHLPQDQWFVDHRDGSDIVLARLEPGKGSSTLPCIYYSDTAAKSYRRLDWLLLGVSTGTAKDCRIHQVFRLPSDYVSGTDLTAYLSTSFTCGTVLTIDAVSAGAGGTFTITGQGDLTANFPVGSTFWIIDSTNNDGEWTVASVNYAGTDFTITVVAGETVGAVADGTTRAPLVVADEASIAVQAIRNIPSAGKEGFGARTHPLDDATWVDNDDLITAGSPITVAYQLTGSTDFDVNELTIDGDDASFPLTPGNLVALELTCTVDAPATLQAAMWMANPYIVYDRWAT